MKQITYQEAHDIVIKRFKARGIKDTDWQIRQLGFKQFASGIEARFQHYETGRWRKTYIKDCYLPDRPDPSLTAEEYAKAKAKMAADKTLASELCP